jgi:leucyl aminopeptidase
MDKWLDTDKEQISFEGKKGPVWIFLIDRTRENRHHYGLLQESVFAKGRERGGTWARTVKESSLRHVDIHFLNTNDEAERGIYVGIDLAAYSFKTEKASRPELRFLKNNRPVAESETREARALARGLNLARHLVNLPPSHLNPASYAEFIVQTFAKRPHVSVEVWDSKRLEKEKMGLHLAVGRGAEHGPCMVRVKYRPRGSRRKQPIAFVGKGITFDSGGLDLKPSSGMRLMKKDMGGSAALVGLAHWAQATELKVDCDFYLALAENSVDAKSFRPSDVCIARNGLSVEIHNTDAEGRLVLADVLDVAVTCKDAPEIIVDVATLTGAIKVALGADLPGLFCNHDRLADAFLHEAQAWGDACWRMPLYSKYNTQMTSAFADVVNAIDGYGGAITAALFLEKFVGSLPWMHLDIYAWNDRANGGLGFAGGSGQGVQALAGFLRRLEDDPKLNFKG